MKKNDTTVKLSKIDFFNKLELESKDRYPRYRKLVHGLINKTFVEIKELDGTHLMGVIITGSKWYVKQPFFEVKLNDWFMPFLEQLVRDYTKIQLDSILKLKSKYSLSLYKWLCSWTDESKKTNQRYITTKDLKELLGLNINDYVYNCKFQRKLFENYTVKKALVTPQLIYEHWRKSHPNEFDIIEEDNNTQSNIIINITEPRKIENND